MKKIGKFAIVLGAIFIVSGFLATALFFSSFDWNNFDESDYFGYVNEIRNFSVEGLEEVKLDFVSEDIILEKISGNEFVFNLSGYYPHDENGEYPEMKLDKYGNNLKVYIEYPQKRYIFGINSRESKLYIGVPENYNGDFIIDVVSGDINIEGVTLGNFDVESVSGNVNIMDSKLDKVNFDSVSGDIKIENFDIMNYASFESVSGNVELDLAEGSSVEVLFESVSGKLRNDFGEIRNGENKIIVDTVSGDLRVY